MIPYSDGIPARRFPVVNVGLIVANFAVSLSPMSVDLSSALSLPEFWSAPGESRRRPSDGK
jgi:hypothetical protein